MAHLNILIRRHIPVFFFLACMLQGSILHLSVEYQPAPTPGEAYIIQSSTAEAAEAAVVQAGGVVTRPLPIIHGVAATLGPAAQASLQYNPRIVLHPDASVYMLGEEDDQETDTRGYRLYPAAATGAHLLHELTVWTPQITCSSQHVVHWGTQKKRALQGWGTTVAMVDTGLLPMASIGDWKFRVPTYGTLIAENSGRCIIYRDFLPRNSTNENGGNQANNSVDQNGHGTHVASTIADNRETALAAGRNGTPVGVAPQVNLVVARALDKDGVGTYSDVIAAIEWIVAHKESYHIRILNLSLYAPVTGPYWADPLNQAVMRAWQSGIVVVVAAGNDGPKAGTITVPGNVPYVITVGAITSGRYTASNLDELAIYSSRGPTESAFVKPDVLVPATYTIAPMPTASRLADLLGSEHIVETASVDYKVGAPSQLHAYYRLSGTSMAAAQVSGIAALMLQLNPTLTNDQVKYRLLATARPAINPATGKPVYTIWEQGAGLVDAQQAVLTTQTGIANGGMDIALDLDAQRDIHYWGNTTWDATTGEFRLVDPNSGDPLEAWNGGQQIGSEDVWNWIGEQSNSPEETLLWGGGRRTRTGSDLLWAGNDRRWVQPPGVQALDQGVRIQMPEMSAPGTEDEEPPLTHVVWLPMLVQSK